MNINHRKKLISLVATIYFLTNCQTALSQQIPPKKNTAEPSDVKQGADTQTSTEPTNSDPKNNSLSDIDKVLLGGAAPIKNKEAAIETPKQYRIPSIMFSDEEIKKINKALDAYNNDVEFVIDADGQDGVTKEDSIIKAGENIQSYIYLNSILYKSKNNWSVWINGEKISSDTNSTENEIYIKSINGKRVGILWTLSLSKWKILSEKKPETPDPKTNSDNKVETILFLKPNQTYKLIDNTIIEGKVLLGIVPESTSNDTPIN